MQHRSIGERLSQPPYPFLPYAVFLYAALCWILHPYGAVRSGYIADPDDYMRLNEVMNWLQGQGWFDLSHPRVSPGTNTVVHWARLLDIPIALIAWPLQFVMGLRNALLLASFIIPPALFAVAVALSSALARPLCRGHENLAAVVLLFCPLVLMNYMPGRVDHHGWQILAAGYSLVALAGAVNGQTSWKLDFLTAMILVCGLWIGTEAMPWVALFVACLGFNAAWQGGAALKQAARFGAFFLFASVLVLALAVTPDHYTDRALSWYSGADVLFAGLTALMFACAWLVAAPLKGRLPRMSVMAGAAFIVAAVFVMLVPEIRQGPFADYDEFDATIALDGIGEAQPFLNQIRFNPYFLMHNVSALMHVLQGLWLSLLGVAGLILAWKRGDERQKMYAGFFAAYLLSAIGLTVFCQMRVGWFMQYFAAAAVVPVIVAVASGLKEKYTVGYPLFAAVALSCLLPVVLIPAAVADAPLATSVLMFPANRGAPSCDLHSMADYLANDWAGDAHKQIPHTIMASGNEGPELAFRTPHNVIAANFNVAGNADAYEFFGARDDAVARRIAARWGADRVLICRSFPLTYARLMHARLGKTAFLGTAADGKMYLFSDPQHPALVERLARGPVPDWLKPVVIPYDTDYLLFEIKTQESGR